MAILVIAISAVLLFFPVYALFSQVVGDDWGAGIAGFFMYIWYPYLALKFLQRRDKPVPDDMSRALSYGALSVSEYSVRRCVEFSEAEDEGLLFLLDVGEQQTLCLQGQYLYDVVASGQFPTTSIKVFWHKFKDFSYGVECCGEPLLPFKTLPPLDDEQYALEWLPADRELIDEDLDTLLAKLTRAR